MLEAYQSWQLFASNSWWTFRETAKAKVVAVLLNFHSDNVDGKELAEKQTHYSLTWMLPFECLQWERGKKNEGRFTWD